MNNETSRSVFAFEVWVKETDWMRIINARNAGKAKYAYWRDLIESWLDIPFTAIRCRKIGAAYTSQSFTKNAEYRGWQGTKCGDRVRVGQSFGTIIGHNSSANFDVLFDDDAPEYAGLTLNCHPQECYKI